MTGYEKGPVKRHGCPSHGIALTPDEKEIWLADGANSKVHVFDATVMPPKQIATIGVRDQPGWITFSLDGRYAYPSTGEVIDAATKQIVTTLSDEAGMPLSEREDGRSRVVERQADRHRRSVRHRSASMSLLPIELAPSCRYAMTRLHAPETDPSALYRSRDELYADRHADRRAPGL